MPMVHRVVAEIDLSALTSNVGQIKLIAPHSKILAMIKGNAYGHGIIPVAEALVNLVDAFGVIGVDDAWCLINARITSLPIVILSGFTSLEELKFFALQSCEIVIHNFNQINILENNKLDKKINVWLKIDTGMHRLGFSRLDAHIAYQKLISIESVVKPLKLMTHFSDADEKNNPKTLQQIQSFFEVSNEMIGEKSAANSAAIFNFPQSHFDWIRPGIALYGVSPIREQGAVNLNLRPVMTLKSRIMAIHSLQQNDPVGYGSSWCCPENMKVGIAMIGYGDGYPLGLRSNTPVLVNGVQCRLVGKVAMDMINIDLRNCPSAKIGDEVILWGDGLSVEEVAKNSDASRYELLTRLTVRVFHRYK